VVACHEFVGESLGETALTELSRSSQVLSHLQLYSAALKNL